MGIEVFQAVVEVDAVQDVPMFEWRKTFEDDKFRRYTIELDNGLAFNQSVKADTSPEKTKAILREASMRLELHRRGVRALLERQEGVKRAATIVRNYSRAVTKWVAAGRPTRSRLEVNEILGHKCKKCRYYHKGKCTSCGCRVNSQAYGLLNKIKMATEHCKYGGW